MLTISYIWIIMYPIFSMEELNMITFEKLFQTMEKKNITGYKLMKDKIIRGGTIDRIKSNQSISTETINKLCNYLHCKPMDIMTYSPDKVDPGNTISGD